MSHPSLRVMLLIFGLIALTGCAESTSKNQSPIATDEERAIVDQVTSEKIAELNAAEEQALRKNAQRAR